MLCQIPPKAFNPKWPWCLQQSSYLLVPVFFIIMITHLWALIRLSNVAWRRLAEQCNTAEHGGATAFLVLHAQFPGHSIFPFFRKIWLKNIMIILPCKQRERKQSSHWISFVLNVWLWLNKFEINFFVLVGLI